MKQKNYAGIDSENLKGLCTENFFSTSFMKMQDNEKETSQRNSEISILRIKEFIHRIAIQRVTSLVGYGLHV